MPPVGFEPTISAGERPQTYALDRAATGTDNNNSNNNNNNNNNNLFDDLLALSHCRVWRAECLGKPNTFLPEVLRPKVIDCGHKQNGNDVRHFHAT